jgi:hypothetical protein
VTARSGTPVIRGDMPVTRGEVPVIRGEVPVIRGEVPVIRGEVPVIIGRFDCLADAERAVVALRDAGIASQCIEGPASPIAAIAVTLPGRSDRYFVIETLRELGAIVQDRESLTPA